MAKAVAHGLTDEEVKTVHSAARRVWDVIGWDCLAEVKSLPRSHVIELVCDASRLERELRSRSPELATKIEQMAYPTLIGLLTPMFPHGRYGR